MLLRPVAYVTWPLNSRSQISLSGELIVILSKAAVTVVTSSPVCLYAMTPDRASRSINNVPSLVRIQLVYYERYLSGVLLDLMCPSALRYVSESHGSPPNGSICKVEFNNRQAQQHIRHIQLCNSYLTCASVIEYHSQALENCSMVLLLLLLI